MTDSLPHPVASKEQPALLDVDQVAALLNCSPRHVRRLADGGRMPAPIKLGRLIRWRRDQIETWVEGGCRPIGEGRP